MKSFVRILTFALINVIIFTACLPGPPSTNGNGQTITVYGFSIMKEALEKDIYPAFAAKWKREHGVDINFVSSFAGSETVTNQILQGAPADVAILSIERDAERLAQGRASTTDWHTFPNNGIINKTPFVILVRKGNPKQIADFPDLAKPDVKVIHPDPVSSGGAQWSILSIYGSELKKSEVESGDTLVSEKNTYAQIRFIDNSEITLRPGTTFKIENFAYDAEKPDGDSAAFSLVKGGLRSITGLLGKRNKEKFQLKTPTATIGIRGTTFVAQWVEVPAQEPRVDPAMPGADLAPGLHVAVLDGMIVVTNAGGAQNFPAGQFGYVPAVNQAPVVVPPHPALQFVPPPSFGGEGGGPLASQGAVAQHGGADCIVR